MGQFSVEKPVLPGSVLSGKQQGGLYLVLQRPGAKSWAVRYRFSRAPKKLTLGSYPAVDLATARKRAQ